VATVKLCLVRQSFVNCGSNSSTFSQFLPFYSCIFEVLPRVNLQIFLSHGRPGIRTGEVHDTISVEAIAVTTKTVFRCILKKFE